MLITMSLAKIAALIAAGSAEVYLGNIYVRSTLAIRNKRKEEARERAQVFKEMQRIDMEKKEKIIDCNHAIYDKAEPENYTGRKAPTRHSMLLGFDKDHNEVWGEAVNYIVAGTTGNGKSRKLHVLLLNWLANKQGMVIIIDLKKTDYKLFIGCKGVAMYIDELEQVTQAVKAFEEEYNRRIAIIEKGYTDENGIVRQYIDVEDYNKRNPDNKLADFLLLIDEYADIADVYKDRMGRPTGVYADLIKLARKCRAVGGRIILGTQRPSVDVIIGTLKNNTEIIAMGCLNEINSKIMLDVPGAEELEKREALMYVGNKLTKVFSYGLDDQMLLDLTDKLK